jgi:hypothetical protein
MNREDPLDELIRRSGPEPAAPETIDRIAERVLLERARVLAAGKRRRKILIASLAGIAAAAAIAVIADLASHRDLHRIEPDHTIIAVPEPGPGPEPGLAPAPQHPSLPPLDDAVDAALDEVRSADAGGPGRTARSAAGRLLARRGNLVETIVESARENGRRRTAAVEVLAALGTTRAREAIGEILDELAAIEDGGVALRDLDGRRDVLTPALLARFARLPAAGPWSIAVLAARDPASGAKVLLEERLRRKEEFPEFLGRLLERLPADPAAFAREVARAVRRADYTGFAGDLGATGDPNAWPFIEALASFGSAPALIEAAGQVGGSRAVPYLKKFLERPGPLGDRAIDALAAIPDPAAARALFDTWAGSAVFPRGRREALARALEAQGDRAVEVLAALAREGPSQAMAIEALVGVFPGRAAAVLGPLVKGSGPARGALVGALGRLGDPAAAEALIPLLDDPRLAEKVRGSLRRLAGADLGPDPRAWKEWWKRRLEKEGRRAAAPGRRDTEAI